MKIDNETLGDYADKLAKKIRNISNHQQLQALITLVSRDVLNFQKAEFTWKGFDSAYWTVIRGDLPTAIADLYLRGFTKESTMLRKLLESLHQIIVDYT